MRYAVVRGSNETVARSRTSESAHRTSRRRPFVEEPDLRVVEMNQAQVSSSSVGSVIAVGVGQSVVFKPKPGRRLDDAAFNTYRRVTAEAGARFDRAAYAQVAPIGVAAHVVQKLHEAGFEVEFDAALAAAMAGAALAAPVEAGPKSKGLVTVTRRGQLAVFETKSYLGGNFNTYRDALTGAKYDGKVNSAGFQVAVGIIKRLGDAGFSVDVDPELIEVLKSFVSQVSEDVSKSKVRAEELDARLREKGLSLFGYQKDGVAWLAGRHNAMLFDDQGTGKTIQILVSLPEGAPVVVVCPAVVKGVWKLEAAKWRPEFKVTILSGRNSFRWPEPGEIIVTNYDVLSDAVGDAPPGTVVVGDECQAVKGGTKVLRGKRFRALAKAARDSGGRSWGASGTPLLNRPTELWNILMAFGLAEEAFGSYKQFVEAFNGTPGEWGGYTWGIPRADVVEKLRRVSLRRMKKDVLPDLPTKVFQTIPVELGAKEKKAIDKALKDAGVKIEDILAAIEAAEQDKFDLPAFTRLSAARAALAMAKIPALLELIEGYEEAEDPIVVFSAHRAPVDVLGDRAGWAVITGDVANEKRTEIVADFQAGKLKGIALTIKAGGEGITLTRASTEIFVDEDWTPGKNEQAQDRILRIGQTRGANYKTIVADHVIDERVHELLAKKRGIIDASIDASATTKAKSSELADVDFDALSSQARREAEDADRRAREIAEASERLALMDKEERERERERIDRERDEEKKRRRSEDRDERAGARARRLDDESEPERRQARDAVEQWAANAVVELANLDPDAAYFRNDVGFSKADGGAGHWLAAQIRSGQGLTSGQWKLAKQFAYRYQGQVGRPPA